ncbi:MAG: polymer-forming cytoskeletal protein [Candidatus Firestonebacteria bacterium]|nr:polymer-forming cytoskeletal protein [Candidatus Firestonebacteria bacterium]
MAVVQDRETRLDNSAKIGTLLGPGAKFHGEMVSDGNIRIDGQFKGKIKSKGTLYIGKSGDIHADIDIGSVIIGGKVKGNILAKTKLELISPAKLQGNINTPRISIEEGVIFEGMCTMNTRKNMKESIPQLTHNTFESVPEEMNSIK